MTFQIKILQEELEVDNCSLEAAFKSKFGEFRRWQKGDAILKKDEHLVELHEDHMRPRSQSK